MAELRKEDLRAGGSMRRTLAFWFVISTIGLTSCATVNSPRRDDLTLDDVFTRPESAPGFWRDHEFAVTVRFTQDDALERQVTLAQGTGGVSARVVEAVGSPVWQQIEDRAAPVAIRSYTVADEGSLASLLDAFGNLRVRLLPSRTLYLHPKTLTVWATTAGGSTQMFVTMPPSNGAPVWGNDTGSDADLWAWAERLETVVLREAKR